MKTLLRHLACTLPLAVCPAAQAASMHLTSDMPECRMPATKPLPEKYLRLAKRYKEFDWARKVAPNARHVSGKSWERIDGSSIYGWFDFYALDLNGDGWCDWFVNASAPMSTGGDRDSINTIYLGQPNGWTRTGAPVPENKPDELGFGKTLEEQKRYMFGEDIAVIYDADSRISYFVSAFYDRHDQYIGNAGYRILAWDADKRSLRLLDKWQPQSKAAEVYAYFKTHGARLPASKTATLQDKTVSFDPEIEKTELDQACYLENPQRSRHLPARCER